MPPKWASCCTGCGTTPNGSAYNNNDIQPPHLISIRSLPLQPLLLLLLRGGAWCRYSSTRPWCRNPPPVRRPPCKPPPWCIVVVPMQWPGSTAFNHSTDQNPSDMDWIVCGVGITGMVVASLGVWCWWKRCGPALPLGRLARHVATSHSLQHQTLPHFPPPSGEPSSPQVLLTPGTTTVGSFLSRTASNLYTHHSPPPSPHPRRPSVLSRFPTETH